MAIMKITGSGLSSIAMLVTLLWGCVLGEHVIMQRANQELSGAMTQIHLMQKQRLGPVPVSLPPAHRVFPPRTHAG